MSISLFASSNRPQLYPSFIKSLEVEAAEIEVVFAGPLTLEDIYRYIPGDFLRYIKTENIKPAQCYEVARRDCSREVVVWVADDCEFVGGILTKAYNYWKEQKNEKLILSLQTKETGYRNKDGSFFNMRDHSLIGFKRETPLMAPLGMMSRDFLNSLGGIDRRYVCGQYENDIVMRAYAEGGSVEIFGDRNSFVDIDHLGKSISIGESVTESDFLKRPFAAGYRKDREVLEKSWLPLKRGAAGWVRHDAFEPYEEDGLREVSQSNNLDRWC